MKAIMLLARRFGIFANFLTSASIFLLSTLAESAPGKNSPPTSGSSTQNEIPVQLFGQNCTLQGPFPKDVLRSIHAISPEQNPSPKRKEEIQNLKNRLQNLSPTPQPLERYRERALKYLETRAQFYKAMDAYAKSKKKADFLSVLQSEILPSRKSAFTKQIEQPVYSDLAKPEVAAQVELLYLNATPPAPDEEFHRTIQRMNVWYSCTMEEESNSGSRQDE